MKTSKELAIPANAPDVIEDAEVDVLTKQVREIDLKIKEQKKKTQEADEYNRILVSYSERLMRLAHDFMCVEAETVDNLEGTIKRQFETIVYQRVIMETKKLKKRRKIANWTLLSMVPIPLCLVELRLVPLEVLWLSLPFAFSWGFAYFWWARSDYIEILLSPFLKNYEYLENHRDVIVESEEMATSEHS